MNALSIIFPYKWNGQWVFDDESVGLVREPFVSGIDVMIDRATAEIPNAAKGFKLIFSPTPFPRYTLQLDWRRAEFGGNWYWCEQFQVEGWLCPALFKYFTTPPLQIFGKASPKN